MRRVYVLLLGTALVSGVLLGQKIDNTAIYRDMGSDSYFRFSYDNDYFSSTDRNYTQGYSFEFGSPSFARNPLNYLLVEPEADMLTYGLALEHIGYTPYRYTAEEIQFGDRPFASAIMLKSFAKAKNLDKRRVISSSLSLGMMGPIAFGEWMQVSIHEATGNKIPLGWHNQISNDFILNYRLDYSKELWAQDDWLSLSGTGTAQIGTLFNNASIGANLMVGPKASPFLSTDDKSGFRAYFFANPRATVVEYDATLQGGKFNRDSPYVISSSEIERLTTTLEFGLVVQSRKLYLEYTRSFISKEFKSGESARWGGIKIGLKF